MLEKRQSMMTSVLSSFFKLLPLVLFAFFFSGFSSAHCLCVLKTKAKLGTLAFCSLPLFLSRLLLQSSPLISVSFFLFVPVFFFSVPAPVRGVSLAFIRPENDMWW